MRFMPKSCDGCQHHRIHRIYNKQSKQWVFNWDECQQVDDGYTNDYKIEEFE